MKRAHWLIGTLAITMGVVACDTMEPGDYVVYRVASTSSELSDGCYWQYQGADANVRHDSSTLKASGTFVMYAGVEEARYLDVGSVTLDGEYTGDGAEGEDFEFTGRTVDIEFDNPDGTGSKRTTTITTEVEMTVDGELVFGEVKTTTSWACEGSTCGELPPSCTETVEFVGTEVEDVSLEHDVPVGLDNSSGSGTSPVDDDDGGVGGNPGAGGGGGNGGAGGGTTTCQTCSDIVFYNEPATQLCEPSTPLLTDLMSCACSSFCSEQCGDNLCTDPSTTDSICQACLETECWDQYNECWLDTNE